MQKRYLRKIEVSEIGMGCMGVLPWIRTDSRKGIQYPGNPGGL